MKAEKAREAEIGRGAAERSLDVWRDAALAAAETIKRLYRLLQESDGHKRLARFAKCADERQAALVERNRTLGKEVGRLRETLRTMALAPYDANTLRRMASEAVNEPTAPEALGQEGAKA